MLLLVFVWNPGTKPNPKDGVGWMHAGMTKDSKASWQNSMGIKTTTLYQAKLHDVSTQRS